ncbi:MAG: hypothetical protein WDZ51_04325 [Pirellulaceae bacterium]
MDQLPSPNEPLPEGRDTKEDLLKITVEVTPAQSTDAHTNWTVPTIEPETPYDQLLPLPLEHQPPPAILEHQGHRWIVDQYFYSLPKDLWKQIDEALPEGPIAPYDREVERHISEICGDHSTWAGVWNNARVQYTGLRRSSKFSLDPNLSEGQDVQGLIVEMGWDQPPHNLNPAKVANSIRVANNRFTSPFLQALSAYPGWLLTNRTFIEEQEQLVQDLRQEIRQWGTAPFHLSQPAMPKYLEINNEGHFDLSRTMAMFQEFLARWRLSCLTGPDLPVPQGPMMDGDILPAMMRQLSAAGGLFFVPDTVPLPSRDDLRDMLGESLHKRADQSHLTEWQDLIANDRPDRGPLRKFQRLFKLQHYWRLLHQRHPQIFKGNLRRLREIFGTFLEVSAATIMKDLQEVEDRLGKGWETRKSPLE